MKYRGRSDVAQALLESCIQPVTWTKAMYAAYVSYDQMNEYIPILEGNGLVTVNEDKVIHTTKKGLKFLEQLKVIGMVLTPIATGKKGTVTKSGN